METVIRIAVIYVFVFVGLRLMGKREFSQMAPMELVTLLLIPEIVSQSLVGEDFSLTNAIIGVSTLFVLVYLTSSLTHMSKGFEDLVESPPTVLAHHGRFVEANLDRERITADEVYGEMRKYGLERIEQVRWAVLESDGKISFVPAEGGDSVRAAPNQGELTA